MSGTLLKQSRFMYLFWCQVCGTFNDHLMKTVFVLIAAQQAASTGVQPIIAIGCAGAAFMVPFVIFSGLAGQVGDRYDKALLIRRIKLAELGIVTLAAVSMSLDVKSLMLLCLVGGGVVQAFFSTVKYGLLPSVLGRDELVGGNGLVEAGAFTALFAATLLAQSFTDDGSVGLSLAWLMVAVAAGGALGAARIAPSGAADPSLVVDAEPFRQSWAILKEASSQRSVLLPLLGIGWFYFIGSFMAAQLPHLAREVLGADTRAPVALLACFAAGVAIGSLLCEKLSSGRLEIGLVPFGSLGVSLFALDLWVAAWGAPGWMAPAARSWDVVGLLRLGADIVLIGVSAGIYVVPLYAMLQSRTALTHQCRMMAASNLVNSLVFLCAAGAAFVMAAAGASTTDLILACALANVAVGAYIYTLVPAFLWRFIAWVMVRVIYRVETPGLANVPSSGAALLVANHVSFADAPVLSAVVNRPMRFVMYWKIFNVPVLNLVFRGMRAIPIAERKASPETLRMAYDEVADALGRGELVFIFPEGMLSRDGEMREFKQGVERIVSRTPVPVIPVGISGLWKSVWSRNPVPWWRRAMDRSSGRRLVIAFGEPVLPADVDARDLQRRVAALRVPGLA